MRIDSDRDWTNGGDSSFEGTFVLMFDVIACRDCSTDVVFVEVTGSIDTPEIIGKKYSVSDTWRAIHDYCSGKLTCMGKKLRYQYHHWCGCK